MTVRLDIAIDEGIHERLKLAKLDANDRTHAAIIGVKRGIIER